MKVLQKKIHEIVDFLNPARNSKTRIDGRILIVCVSVSVSLTMVEFWGMPRNFFHCFPSAAERFGAPVITMMGYVYWSCSCLLWYVLFPIFLCRFFLKEDIFRLGLSTKGIRTHLWLYGTLFLAVLPFIVIASFWKSFQAVYPFYCPPPGAWYLYLIFEFFYLLQFFSLEFFFRGYMLFTLEKSVGYYSVFIMTIPYCMIHYHKPFPEAMAAIVAGIILGTLSLRTRSIWYGVLIHVSVALSMDLLSLLQKGYLVRLFLG